MGGRTEDPQRRDKRGRLFCFTILGHSPKPPRLPSQERFSLLPNFITYIMSWRRRPRLWDGSWETIALTPIGRPPQHQGNPHG